MHDHDTNILAIEIAQAIVAAGHNQSIAITKAAQIVADAIDRLAASNQAPAPALPRKVTPADLLAALDNAVPGFGAEGLIEELRRITERPARKPRKPKSTETGGR